MTAVRFSGQSPIEWNPTLGVVAALTPTNFGPGSSCFIPLGCGGDVTSCGAMGTFAPSSTRDNQIVSGTYTAIDVTENLQGGSPGAPVLICGQGSVNQGSACTEVAQVAGTITGGQEDYYSFYWSGGAFSASTTIANALSTDTLVFSAGTVGTCNGIGSATLNSGDSFTGTISQGNLAAGNYCIGLDDVSGGDPNFAITFATRIIVRRSHLVFSCSPPASDSSARFGAQSAVDSIPDLGKFTHATANRLPPATTRNSNSTPGVTSQRRRIPSALLRRGTACPRQLRAEYQSSTVYFISCRQHLFCCSLHTLPDSCRSADIYLRSARHTTIAAMVVDAAGKYIPHRLDQLYGPSCHCGRVSKPVQRR